MSQKIIDKIRAGEFSYKELENLYANAERLGREEILIEAKEAIKNLDFRSYSKRFIKPIRDKVKKIAEELATKNNWTDRKDNKMDNGIKAGSAMIDGQELAQFNYFYRHHAWKKPAYFAVFQHDEESAVMYKIGPHNGDQFIVETREEAIWKFSEAIKSA